MAIKIKIGNEVFATKVAAKSFMHALIARYGLRQNLNADDMAFCLELFKRHPDYPQKLGPGVEKIQVRTQKFNTKGFQIFKVDGTDDDISWHDCLGPSQK